MEEILHIASFKAASSLPFPFVDETLYIPFPSFKASSPFSFVEGNLHIASF